MDEMKIVSKFTRGIISKAIKMVIADGKTHLHVDVDAEIGKDELVNILKSIGLN